MKRTAAVLLCLVLLLAITVPAFGDAGKTPPYPDSKFFSCGEYELHYRVKEPAGEKKGQILLLHGFLASTCCWEPLSAILAENGYECVLVDLPDFGFSSRETAGSERVPREDLIYALMTALSDEPWYVAGHSMGGYTALALAQKYPDSVKNVLLYSAAGNNGVFDLIRPLTTNDTVARLVGRLIERIGANRTLVRFIMSYATRDRAYLAGYDYDALMAPYRIEGTGAGIVYSLSTHTRTDYEAVRHMAPILDVTGTRDIVCPPTERLALLRSLPDRSERVVLKGAGHMLIESRAAETAAVTLDFLAKNP